MYRCIVGIVVVSLLSALTSATGSGEIRASYLWKQCEEDVVIVYVDPEGIRRLVPAEHRLKLSEGRVRVLLIAQECPNYWFDGQDMGPTQEVHHWVELDKGSSLRPVPGAVTTIPTMSWYPVYMGSTNAKVRQYWVRSGGDAKQFNGLSFSQIDEKRSGEVSEGEGKGYSWIVETGAPFAPTVGVNHDLYGRSPDGEPVFHRIECLAAVKGWASKGSLHVNGGSDPTDLISEGKYDVEVHTFKRVWCQATLAEGK